MDEDFVKEILADARPGMSPAQFAEFTRRDVNAGYKTEVDEAERRYFGKQS